MNTPVNGESIKRNITKNIVKYREQANLTQKELAKRLNVTPSRVSNWEQGANSPTIEILFEVCNVLGVSINDIYGIYPNTKMDLAYGELDLIKKYRTLDTHGKKIVNFVLTEESERIKLATSEETELVNIAKAAHNQQPLLLDEEGIKEFAKKANEAPNSAHDKEMF